MRRLVPLAWLLAVACAAALYVRQQSDTLYFGTARADGTVVSSAEWQQFLLEVVTPRFPAFTHWEAQGEWKNTREETHVLVIIHEPGHSVEIQQIIDEYKKRFGQEEVLWVRTEASVRKE